MSKKGVKTQKLKAELKEIKFLKNKASKDDRLRELALHFASEKEWTPALESFELITNEKERNLLIADLIEKYLLPTQEIILAKKFAKYLTPVPEIEPLVWIRIALADDDTEEAQKLAEHLPSPLSRNFAFVHIMEAYLENNEKNKAEKLAKLMKENIRTIYDNKSRSYILRELALNLFLPNKEKAYAKEMAQLIPDESIKTQVLNKINTSK